MGKRAAVVVFLLFAGCGGDSAPDPAPAPKPAGTIDPAALATETPIAVPGRRTLRFRSSDGKRLRGRLYPARRPHAPAVVLVHQLNGGPDQWAPLIGPLHRAGFTSLAYTSRNPAEADEAKLARDVAGAITVLRRRREVDPDRIVLTGASIGATTVAYVLGTDDHGALGGVALSPVEGPRELALGQKDAFRPHDLLLISDEREATDLRSLRHDAGGKGVTVSVDREHGGHGVALLEFARDRERVIGWLKRLAA